MEAGRGSKQHQHMITLGRVRFNVQRPIHHPPGLNRLPALYKIQHLRPPRCCQPDERLKNAASLVDHPHLRHRHHLLLVGWLHD